VLGLWGEKCWGGCVRTGIDGCSVCVVGISEDLMLGVVGEEGGVNVKVIEKPLHGMSRNLRVGVACEPLARCCL